MRISYNWLKEYIALDESPEKVAERLTDCGLEVEGSEEFCTVEGGLEGVVIGQVLSCRKHPDADRLTLCQVDIGDGEPVQIVCGAPNVAEGQKVPVATVGTKLYGGGEAFTIKRSKIRGESSAGMICAEDELGLGESHEGIMVLDPATPVGTPAAEYFGVSTDHVFEIGLTPNRPDAASHTGTARDLVAVYNAESASRSARLNLPSVEHFSIDDHELPIPVELADPDRCPRYSGISLTHITVGPSPQWMQDRLLAAGVRPLNNIVDITNYVMLETGQPLHAFDAQKIRGGKVLVRTLGEATPFITLDEAERKLSAEDLMICDTEGGMCMAGIFGGIGSGVSEATTSIFLESACFDPVSIRTSARRHQLNTDASFRFERGTDPGITIYALKRACLLMREIAGARISSDIVDIYPGEKEAQRVSMSREWLDRLTGLHIPDAIVDGILDDLGFTTIEKSAGAWLLSVPGNKVDVTRQADVIEEVLRIYGYNRVPLPERISFSPGAKAYGDEESLRNLISDHLSARGFAETMTNSLTNAAYAKSIPGLDESSQVRMLNAISSELDVMRQSLLPGGLETLRYNLNRQHGDLRFYEFGKVYRDKGKGEGNDHGRFEERWGLALFISGNATPENWKLGSRAADVFDMGHEVAQVLERLGIGAESSRELNEGPFSQALALEARGRTIVRYGEVLPRVRKAFDIEQALFMAEFDWDLVMELASANRVSYTPVPRYPSVRRDLALVIDRGVSYARIRELAFRTERRLLRELNLFDVYEGEKIPSGKVSYAVSFILRDPEKTLTDKAIEKTMKGLVEAFGKELGATLR